MIIFGILRPVLLLCVCVHVHEFEQVRMWTLLQSLNYVCSGLALSASPDV